MRRRPGWPILDLAGKVDGNRRVLQSSNGYRARFSPHRFPGDAGKNILSQFIRWQIPFVYARTSSFSLL
jgi:hypothetical protein